MLGPTLSSSGECATTDPLRHFITSCEVREPSIHYKALGAGSAKVCAFPSNYYHLFVVCLKISRLGTRSIKVDHKVRRAFELSIELV